MAVEFNEVQNASDCMKVWRDLHRTWSEGSYGVDAIVTLAKSLATYAHENDADASPAEIIGSLAACLNALVVHGWPAGMLTTIMGLTAVELERLS